MADDQYLSHRISSWDTNGYSRSFEPSQNIQHGPSLSMSAPNYIVPYNSQIRSQYSIDERHIQKYQTPQTNKTETGVCESIKKQITVTRVIGLLVGLILTGVPLAVIVTLYVQLSTSSNSSVTDTTSTTISTSVSLPYQCSASYYSTWNDNTRLTTYSGCTSLCDSVSGWYRVTGSSGTRLATSPVSTGYCGTNSPAWFNGSLPTTAGSTTTGIGCVNYSGNICHPSYSSSVVLATNCNGFYVFYVTPVSCICCSSCYYARYCTL